MAIYVEKVVRHWGFGDAPNGYIPRNLDELINELMQARLEIPQEYWGDAYIELDQSYEHGEYYSKLLVGYTRPETTEESTAREDESRAHWQGQLDQARARVEYCQAQLQSPSL